MALLINRPRSMPAWRPHKNYEPPIWDHLQSSYADVRAELEKIRDELQRRFPKLKVLFVAGDGLSLMRMNELLQNESDEWIENPDKPVIIPVQGEHPHGLFHAMDCQLRLYKSFLVRLTEHYGM